MVMNFIQQCHNHNSSLDNNNRDIASTYPPATMNGECQISCEVQSTAAAPDQLNSMTSMSFSRRRCRRPTATRRSTMMLLAAALATLVSHTTVVAAAQVGSARTSSKADNNADNADTKKTTFRVFQTLPAEPSQMTSDELSQMHRSIRSTQAMIFSPSGGHTTTSLQQQDDDDVELALDIYSPMERREYLVKRGDDCHPRSSNSGSSSSGAAGAALKDQDEDTSLQWYDVLSRYDSLMAASSSANANANKDADSKKSKEDDKATTAAAAASSANSSELERSAIELFKFCILYNGDGHAFWGWEEQLLVPFRNVVNVHVNYGVVVAMDSMVVDDGGTVDINDTAAADPAGEVANDGNNAINADGTASSSSSGTPATTNGRYIHESFLSISPYTPATSELSAMIRLLLETPDDVLALSPLLLPRELHRLIAAKEEGGNSAGSAAAAGNGDGDEDGGSDGESNSNGATWTLLQNSCIPLANLAVSGSSNSDMDSQFASLVVDPSSSSSSSSTLSGLGVSASDAHARRMAARCPLSEGGYCCLTFLPDRSSSSSSGTSDGGSSIGKEEDEQQMLPVMALRHPVGGWTSGKKGGGPVEDQQMPYAIAHAQTEDVTSQSTSTKPLKLGGVSEADLPYISTVRLVQNNTHENAHQPAKATKFPTHPADTPNFFDILFENDCLPYRKECHRCLKDVANEAPTISTDENGEEQVTLTQENACSKCQLECPCYCDILCKIRPQPKPITRTYSITPPKYRKEPNRLVPKIIHQTWFEPVTKDKYPNMSRLIESWKKSGWEYYFYNDDTAGEFLGSHFPPEVREAYESITPGAFKADLFRYCVLLIRGGVYADMDVLLETNLDDAVANDIGFMTPIDEPGIHVGHRSCLWNGLIASAPGHPFLARTIEIVVNNIRNRFTAVDYDDMLCPNPILSVSHTVDTLFTCGPCILGAGINNLLGRHMQTEFDIGDVDIWQSERSQQEASQGSVADANNNVSVRPDDPRLLIPGRTIILEQNKNDMGAHRFTWADRHLIIASTDMPDYDDRPTSKEHYSKTHEKAGVYGMRKLYTNTKRANEEIRIVVEKL